MLGWFEGREPIPPRIGDTVQAELDKLVDLIMEDVIHELVYEGHYMVGDSPSNDMCLLYESLRSLVYAASGIKHGLQELAQEIYDESPDSDINNDDIMLFRPD